MFIDDDEATARGYGAKGLVVVGLGIAKQVLTLDQGPEYPSWSAQKLYRMENSGFRLIGSEDNNRFYDIDENFIEETTSINYLTGKCNIKKYNLSKKNPMKPRWCVGTPGELPRRRRHACRQEYVSDSSRN